MLASVYGAFRVPVADVAGAFHTSNFTPVLVVGPPVNVTLVCSWTWACSSYRNVHANDAGYRVIASTFARAIDTSR